MDIKLADRIKKGVYNLYIQDFFVFLLYIVVIVLVNHSIISSEVSYVSDDGVMGYLRKLFFIDGIRQGEFPLWNPYTSIGTPYLADVRQTTFSIFNILFLVFEPTLAFNLSRVAQLVIAAYFMYLLVKEIWSNNVAAIMSGFIFAFSVMLGGGRVNHTSIIPAIAFFPVVFYYLEQFHKTSKDRWIAGASIAMALQFLCGFTQTALYLDIVAFVYYIYIVIDNKFNVKRTILTCIKWIGMYILMIGVQLIPTALVMLQSGRESITWEYFSIYSYSLKILLMMISPYIYFNQNEAFGVYQSSGIDVEIYIGIILLTYLIYALIYQIKQRRIKVFAGMLIATFVFGMAANVPVLGEIIYHTPLLSSFRVCARSLHLAIFFALLLVSSAFANFDKLQERKRMLKISVIISIITTSCYIVCCSILSQEQISKNISKVYIDNSSKGLLIAVVLCMINNIGLLATIYIEQKKFKKRTFDKKIIIYLILMCICSLNIVDVMRFSNKLDEQIKTVDTILDKKISKEMETLIANNTNNNYRTFVAANKTIYGLLFGNTDFMYNGYLSFVDKKLKYWGLSEEFYHADMIVFLAQKNPVAAMLGIHYIVDADNREFFNRLYEYVPTEVVCESNEVYLSALSGFEFVSEEAEWIEADSTYRITIEMESGRNKPELFYADFYGQEYAYDGPNELFYINEEGKYETVISTDELPEGKVNFRIIISSGNYKLNNLRIEKLIRKMTYEEIASCDQYKLYSYSKAQKMIYIPEEVKHIDSYGESWKDDELLDVDKISYVEDIEQDMQIDTAHSQVESIDIKRNSVTAVIQTEGETFVNHSQLAYPGWKAYIDGEEVKVYTVNNLIQGVIVPDGEHFIEFRYQPDDVKYGAILSIIGIVLTALWLVYDYRKHKQIGEK